MERRRVRERVGLSGERRVEAGGEKWPEEQVDEGKKCMRKWETAINMICKLRDKKTEEVVFRYGETEKYIHNQPTI